MSIGRIWLETDSLVAARSSDERVLDRPVSKCIARRVPEHGKEPGKAGRDAADGVLDGRR
jgi:hypothetical protein